MEAKLILSQIFEKGIFELKAMEAAFGYGWIHHNKAIVYDNIEESELFWVFVSRQVSSVAVELVARWKLSDVEVVDKPVQYAIQEDFEEELVERLSCVYPPVSIMEGIRNELFKANHKSDGTTEV